MHAVDVMNAESSGSGEPFHGPPWLSKFLTGQGPREALSHEFDA